MTLMRAIAAVLVSSAALAIGCGSSDSSGSGGTSSGGTSSGGTSAGGTSSGGTNAGGSSAGGSAGSDASAPDPNGCEKAGGMCGCFGSCNLGYHPAPEPLLYECPQPCDTCGACSEGCCLPDNDAGTDQ